MPGLLPPVISPDIAGTFVKRLLFIGNRLRSVAVRGSTDRSFQPVHALFGLRGSAFLFHLCDWRGGNEVGRGEACHACTYEVSSEPVTSLTLQTGGRVTELTLAGVK